MSVILFFKFLLLISKRKKAPGLFVEQLLISAKILIPRYGNLMNRFALIILVNDVESCWNIWGGGGDRRRERGL